MTLRLLTVVGLASLVTLSGSEPLRQTQTIELPRVNGRIDHLAFDPGTNRLFVAALGNNTVEVIDTTAGTHLQSLTGFHVPQGIAAAADQKLVAIADGQGAGVEMLSVTDLRRVRSVALGDDSDNVRYDAAAKTLYVGFGDGAIAAIDPATGRVLGKVLVGGHPESFQLETGGPRIFVNVPTARRITVVERTGMKGVAAWPVTTADANYPMALDEAGHRLFIGCRQPAKLLIYDTQSGKEVGSTSIVGDADDLFFDAARKRVYVIGGEGFIDVLDASGAALTRVARIATASGARTGLFVPTQNRLYLAVPHRGTQRAEVRVFEAGS